jgi:exonuclease SbcD
MEDKTFPGELERLLRARSRTNFALAKTNFEIGRLVYETMEKGGEEAVRNLAASCPGSSLSFERFLFDSCRVFRSIRKPGFLYAMNKKLGENLTWGFLLANCTKAPEGDTEEANLYWEGKLSRIEGALSDLESVYDELPLHIREQLDGLIYAAAGGVTAKVGSEREVLNGPITFGHIADIQMCEGFTTAGRLVMDPATGKNERLLDLQKCLDFAIDAMIETDCRVILVPGDLTETERPTPNEQGILRVAFEKAAEKCPVIVCPGNHDLSDNPKDACSLEFLKGRRNIFVVEKPSVLYLEGTAVNREPSETWPREDCIKIFVIPFPSKGMINGEEEGKSIAELNELVSAKLKLLIENFRIQIDPRVPNILMLHIAVAGAEGATNDKMLMFDPNVSLMDLRGFDYVALGHIHKFQRIGENLALQETFPGGEGSLDEATVHDPDDPPVAYYSGSIDRMDFNEENDPKGVIIGTFEGRRASVEFVETPARTFKTLAPAFFESSEWKHKVDSRVIYRIKGDVTKEQYESMKPMLREFPLPLLNKLTVKREIKIRDAGMTDDLKEEDALLRYLEKQGVPQDVMTLCLQEHTSLTGQS